MSIGFNSIYAQSNSALSDSVIKEITEFVKSKADYYNSPSIAVAITDKDSTLYLKHFGKAKKGDKYLIGSNTKSFTALLALILQEEGILNINDPVNKYLTWFQYKNKSISDKITLKNLLQHTSGISTELGRTFFENDNSFDYVQYYTELLKKLELDDLSEQPFSYSNANYRLIGLIIENITGKTYEECLDLYVTKPMNLNETSANLNPDLIDSYQYFLYFPILKFKKSFHRQEIPAGLISSTANDMSIYLRTIMNTYNKESNTVLSSDITTQLFTPNKNNDSGYGLGWQIFNEDDRLVIWHDGANKSFESTMSIMPKLNKAIVVLINSNQAPDVEIISGIHDILLNRKYEDKSSFAYYRSLPFVVLVLIVVFLFQLIKWKKLNYPILLSKKMLPNFLLILGFSFSIAILFYFPKLNGVNLKTAIQFDPTSGYSVSLIVALMLLTFLLLYFNKSESTLHNNIYKK